MDSLSTYSPDLNKFWFIQKFFKGSKQGQTQDNGENINLVNLMVMFYVIQRCSAATSSVTSYVPTIR